MEMCMIKDKYLSKKYFGGGGDGVLQSAIHFEEVQGTFLVIFFFFFFEKGRPIFTCIRIYKFE